ncbi:unnamed protein product [Blepharisma stoltei]|uniref:Uncharacterized protein n=1 Tax=Blepharisma stoltei TaxID=1481888 RepID=A0AAU9JIE2_9CILI|nr:unnamed protein product [Blepharisma stoltei]
MPGENSKNANFNIFSGMFSLLNNVTTESQYSSPKVLPLIHGLMEEDSSRLLIQNEIKPAAKKSKKRVHKKQRVTACPHITKKHYARGMCNLCYHNYGRKAFDWKCKKEEEKDLPTLSTIN